MIEEVYNMWWWVYVFDSIWCYYDKNMERVTIINWYLKI